MNWIGLWQGWDMFAPDPLSINTHLDAVVTYKDGSTAKWEAPRMELLSYTQRYQKERYRKWRERVRRDSFAYFHADTSRFIARQMHSDRANPPVKVELLRHWAMIPPPIEGRDYQPLPKSFDLTHSYAFSQYAVRAEDLDK